MAPFAPWSDLPIDVILDILKPLEIPDLIRFSSVCSSFKRAVSICLKPCTLNPQCLSWIHLYSSIDTSSEDDRTFLHYYSLCENKLYEIPQMLPFCSWCDIDSSHGWCVKADKKSNLHLINPITNKHIPLPPVITMEGVSPILDTEGNLVQYKHQFGETKVDKFCRQFSKVVLSRDPNEGQYIVMLVQRPHEQGFEFRTEAKVSFTKEGEKGWTLLDRNTFYEDFVFRDGLFYGMTELGGIHSFDLTKTSSPTIEIVVDEPDFDDEDYYSDEDSLSYENDLINIMLTPKHAIVAPWGDILVIWRNQNSSDDKTDEINVYKVDVASGTMIAVTSIGDYVLFVGSNSGCFYAKNFSSVRSNSVYFMDGNDVAVYDLTEKSMEYESLSNLFKALDD